MHPIILILTKLSVPQVCSVSTGFLEVLKTLLYIISIEVLSMGYVLGGGKARFLELFISQFSKFFFFLKCLLYLLFPM